MRENIKFFLGSPTLMGLGIRKIFRIAKEVGYDGVEVMLTNYVIRNLNYVVQLARRMDLDITFHQPWEGSYSIFNKILWKANMLPRDFQKVSDLLPDNFSYPTVIQSWRLDEIKDNENYMVQIIFDPKEERENLPLEEIMTRILKEKIKVAFDILYFLEYFYEGIQNIPTDKEKLLEILIEGWDILAQQVTEIHYYGFTHGLGLVGKNLLSEGILPVDDFIQHVARSGWTGRFIFEGSPVELYLKYLFRRGLKRALRKHNYRIEKLISG